MARTFVVGLDGASWELLEPWIEDGTLPNLAALRSEGTWATSRSCLPPSTFPNWKCYSSGKDPGRFGVFWFEQVDLVDGTITTPDSREFETAELWDYLNDDGRSTAVVNMPTMYPPRPIDGYVVCGGPDAIEGEYRQIDSGYTYPTAFEETIEREFDYRVHPQPLLSSDDERGAEVDAILSLLDARFEVATHLFETTDVEFVHVTLFYLNVLHHFFWDDGPTERAWRLVDEWLGHIAEYNDTNLVLMSDHGSAPTETEFYVNEWLAESGYLRKRRTVEDYLQAARLTRETLLGAAKRAGAVELLARIVPERLQRLVPEEAGVKRARKLGKIRLDRTRALASGQGPVYVNPAFDVESTRRSLLADARQLTDEHGRRLFTAVHPGSDVYTGRYVDQGPDLVLEPRPGVHINDGLGGGEVLTEPDRWAAENTPTGIFVAVGPAFDAVGRADDIRITDIMPTLLAANGLAVPTDVSGSVLPFVEGADVPDREPLETDVASVDRDDTTVTERLTDLGYME